jgi:hypothetical protein
MNCSHKTKHEINNLPTAIFVFLDFRKSGLLKKCSSFEDLSAHEISRSYAEWCNFYIHLRSLNSRHFEASGVSRVAQLV